MWRSRVWDVLAREGEGAGGGGGAAGAPAPASVGESPAPDGKVLDTNWDALGDESAEGHVVRPAHEEAKKPEVEAKAEEPSAEEPQVEEPKAEETKTEEPKPPVEEPKPPVDEAARQADLTAKREAMLSELEKQYAFPEDLVEQFASEPEKVLPKLAARVALDAFDMAHRTIMSSLPHVVQAQLGALHSQMESINAFHAEWPELRGKEEAVDRVGKVWRQLNPKATREEAIKGIGMLAMHQLGLTKGAPEKAPKKPATKPVPPAPAAAAFAGRGTNGSAKPGEWDELSKAEI